MFLALLDNLFDSISGIVGIPSDQIRLVVCLFVSFPIGFIFKRIPGAKARDLVSIFLGFLFQIIVYREQVIYPLLMALFGYFGVKILGRNRPRFILIVALLYLSIFHIYRMIVDWAGFSIEITAVLMIYTCKSTAFAYCYQDGAKKDSELSAEQRKNKIVNLPSFIEYMSFMYFYGNTLVGPACEYNDHSNFIKRQGDYAKIPSTLFPSLAWLALGLLNMGIIVTFGKQFTGEGATTEEYANKSWIGKYLYLTIAMQIHRCRYYTAWCIGTANSTSAGLNYDPNGKTEYEKYGKIVAARPLVMETNDNVKEKLEAWNTPCQIWLKNYIYLRIVSEEEAKTNHHKASMANYITFMTSAFWHGFYPGYYFAFFWMFLAQQIAKSLFRMRAKLRWIPEPIGYVLRWALTGFAINWMGINFSLLEVGKALKVYRAWYFIPNIILLIGFVAFTILGVGKSSRPKKDHAKKPVDANGETKKEQ